MNVFRDGVIAFFSAVGMTHGGMAAGGSGAPRGAAHDPGAFAGTACAGRGVSLGARCPGAAPGAEQSAGGTDRHCRLRLTAEARGLADYLTEREDNAAVVNGADFRLDAGNER